ncbi:uncharacterized protein LOC135123029 isoform X2 [Zophobas morio]
MLDLRQLIAEGVDDRLKCFVCTNYLSHFPLFLCSNNKSLCGRCAIPAGTICFENEALETICQFSKFPCRYQSEGCCEELLPEFIPEHEQTCSFRTVSCIISQAMACNWKGCLQSMLHHCRNQHSNFILPNGELSLDLSVSGTQGNLIEYDNKMFIVTRTFDFKTKILQCVVYYNPYERDVKNLPVQLSVRNGNKTTMVDFTTTRFDETQPSLMELCLSHVLDHDDLNASIVTTISIGTHQVSGNSLKDEKINNGEMLAFLKCCHCTKLPCLRFIVVRKTRMLCVLRVDPAIQGFVTRDYLTVNLPSTLY